MKDTIIGTDGFIYKRVERYGRLLWSKTDEVAEISESDDTPKVDLGYQKEKIVRKTPVRKAENGRKKGITKRKTKED